MHLGIFANLKGGQSHEADRSLDQIQLNERRASTGASKAEYDQ